ncbi:CFI-box-CTERM domain-containing protein [Brachyspira pulli]|uniref:CFI-box-CTERM domain-containing protein n=1 Tax=Brachyspira pulli TaxID=310721 RepID=UPI0030072705
MSEEIKNNEYDLTTEEGRKALVQDTSDDIRDNSLIGAIEFSEGYDKVEINTDHKEVKALKEYITSDIDDEKDEDVKKMVTTATYIAAQKGYLGDKMKDKNPDDVARIVDNSLTTTKVAYKVATGEMDAEEVVDYAVDRTTAQVGEIVSTKIEEATTATGTVIGTKVGTAAGTAVGTAVGTVVGTTVGKYAGSAIGASIGSVLGPVGAAAGAVVGAVAGSAVGKAIGGVVKKGIEIVGGAVKTVGRAIGGAVRAVGSAIGSFVRGAADLVSDVCGCYITTAVCRKDNKEDDCYELTMFRYFRDNWLMHQKDGNALIDRYYKIAPQIVRSIDLENNSSFIYDEINNKYLKNCLKMIENKEYEECKKLYIEMVESLEKKYLN